MTERHGCQLFRAMSILYMCRSAGVLQCELKEAVSVLTWFIVLLIILINIRSVAFGLIRYVIIDSLKKRKIFIIFSLQRSQGRLSFRQHSFNHLETKTVTKYSNDCVEFLLSTNSYCVLTSFVSILPCTYLKMSYFSGLGRFALSITISSNYLALCVCLNRRRPVLQNVSIKSINCSINRHADCDELNGSGTFWVNSLDSLDHEDSTEAEIRFVQHGRSARFYYNWLHYWQVLVHSERPFAGSFLQVGGTVLSADLA